MRKKIGGAIITELCRYMPSEILICPPMLDFKDVTTYIKQHTNALVELREDACFKDSVMEATMAGQFGTDWRGSLHYEKDSLVPYAVAALLNYLQETQKHGLERIKTIQNYADAQYMRLSPVTRANLELTETMRGRGSAAHCCGCWIRPRPQWASACCAPGSNSRWSMQALSTSALPLCRHSTVPVWPVPT